MRPDFLVGSIFIFGGRRRRWAMGHIPNAFAPRTGDQSQTGFARHAYGRDVEEKTLRVRKHFVFTGNRCVVSLYLSMNNNNNNPSNEI